MSDTTRTVVRLIPRTEDAHHALGTAEVSIERFPFKVGRKNRTGVTKVAMSLERRVGRVTQLNDIYLDEPINQRHHHVSREHFTIDFTQGKFVLIDRGSVLGTTVNGKTIGGGRRGGQIELHDHDEIAVGKAASPFVFEFRVEERIDAARTPPAAASTASRTAGTG